jgi:hypothetical protein
MKKGLISFAICLSSIVSIAQSSKFMHGTGVTSLGILPASLKLADGNFLLATGVSYIPKYILSGGANQTITLTARPTLATINNQDELGVERTEAIFYNAPLMVEYNLGNNASKESTNRFGLGLGVGVATYGGIFYGTAINRAGVAGNLSLLGQFKRTYVLNIGAIKGFDNETICATVGLNYSFTKNEIESGGGGRSKFNIRRPFSGGGRRGKLWGRDRSTEY